MIKEIDKLDKAKISILAEDTIEFDTPFWGRFGLSLLMELQSKGVCKTILYDTNSASEPIIHNLQILGKSVDELSASAILALSIKLVNRLSEEERHSRSRKML